MRGRNRKRYVDALVNPQEGRQNTVIVIGGAWKILASVPSWTSTAGGLGVTSGAPLEEGANTCLPFSHWVANLTSAARSSLLSLPPTWSLLISCLALAARRRSLTGILHRPSLKPSPVLLNHFLVYWSRAVGHASIKLPPMCFRVIAREKPILNTSYPL